MRDPRTVAVAAVAEPFADAVLWTDGRQALRRRGDHEESVAPSPESRLVDIDFNDDPALAAALAAADRETHEALLRCVDDAARDLTGH